MKSLTFHVSHGDWSADLQLRADHTLYQLAETIIDAVGFDLDHCFGFYDNLKNSHRSKEEYTLFADIGEDARPHDAGVRTTPVANVFRPRRKMLFLFDYGDDWEFLVTCTGEAEVPAFKKCKLIATSGTAPEQYPDYEESED